MKKEQHSRALLKTRNIISAVPGAKNSLKKIRSGIPGWELTHAQSWKGPPERIRLAPQFTITKNGSRSWQDIPSQASPVAAIILRNMGGNRCSHSRSPG
jgi:hypothetical protein